MRKLIYIELKVCVFPFFFFFSEYRTSLTLEGHYKTGEDLFCSYSFHPHIKMGGGGVSCICFLLQTSMSSDPFDNTITHLKI